MRQFSSLKTTTRLFLALGIAIVIALAIIVPLEVPSGHSPSSRVDSPSTSRPVASGATKPTLPQKACAKSGCAVVNTVLNQPHVTVFYGASCTGPIGPWYLNVTEGGPNDTPRPSYELQWAFSTPPSPARPSGSINVSMPAGEKVVMTLANGLLHISGRTPGGININATGTLIVEFASTPSGSTLTFTETGIAAAERALGITSPFGVNGHATSVPVKLMHRFASC